MPIEARFAGKDPKDFAEVVPGPSTRHCCALAKELDIYLTIPLLEADFKDGKDKPRYFNTVCLANPKGELVAHYRKLTPWPYPEKSWATAGDRGVQTYDTEYGRVGLGICFVELVRFFFGSLSKTVPPPAPLVGITPLGFMFYPTYRLALLGIVAAALLVLYVVLYRTRIGMIVRAGIEDSVMVDSLGIDVYKVFMLVFGGGAALAGLAGVIGGNAFVTEPGMAATVGSIIFVVVVVGGMGSLAGAFLASLLIGVIQTFAVAIDYSFVNFFGALGMAITPARDTARCWRRPTPSPS